MAHFVDPDYACSTERPPDFDRFWQQVEAQAREIGLAPRLVRDRLRSDGEVSVYQAFYSSIDRVRVAGWYCLPAGPKGPFPGLLKVPGYKSDPAVPKEWARRGYAALAVAPRGKLRSRSQFDPGYPGLLTYGIVDRNSYSYRGFYVDAWRGIEFLTARPEVDDSRLGVAGSSQGGALALCTAARRPQVRAASVGAPFLAGMLDATELTSSYPYREIADYLRLYPERRRRVEETLAYFDCINFAPSITCPLIMNIGLRDNVCPPETGYAVFRDIASRDKRLYAYPDQGHGAGRHEHDQVATRFLAEHLEPDLPR
jgi:cephalosporin-C deacetylase